MIIKNKNHYILSVILISTILSTGCVQKNVKPIQRPSFPISEYKALNTEGTGVVTGQAFLKTRGGDVKTAAGNEVLLNPVTSYSKQWYDNHYLLGAPLSPIDNKIWEYIIKTVADAEGNFYFTDVPPGEYYLSTSIFWEVATGYRGALEKTGGVIAKKITVKNNKTLKVILAK